MRGVKYNLHFQDRTGSTLDFPKMKMPDLLSKLEQLLQDNYGVFDRISNQTIYNLQKRPEHVSRLLRIFVKVEKAT
jgi:predicted transcriptional regulator